MKMNKIVLSTAVVFTIAVASSIGYYMYESKSEKKDAIKGINIDAQNVETTSKNVALAEDSKDNKINAIGPKTEIIRVEKYTKGIEFRKEQKETPGEDTLGMDKLQFEEKMKKDGYNIDEFTSEKVIISKSINEWPKGSYVIKSIENDIAIFKVGENGDLIKERATTLTLEHVSEHDKMEIQKGKVYETLDQAEGVIAEHES